MNIVGERNQLATSGHFKIFSDFEKIHNDMNQQHSEFQAIRKDFIQNNGETNAAMMKIHKVILMAENKKKH